MTPADYWSASNSYPSQSIRRDKITDFKASEGDLKTNDCEQL
jgi:hypothetical protein